MADGELRLTEEIGKITGWLDSLHADQRIPGWAWVVSYREQTRTVHCGGIASALTRRPVTPDLRWQLGSVGKAFTAIALLQLARNGRLNLSDPLRDHLPWAEHLRPDVTVHHLLSHTGGLPSGAEGYPDSRWEIATLGLLGNPQPPGGPFHYSNCGFEALGDVVEAVTGRALESVLEDDVFGPIGMRDARGSVRPEDRDQEVTGHTPRWDDRPWRRDHDQVPEIWFPTSTADGATTATPADLGYYLRFLINGDDDVLHPDDFALLTARHVQSSENHWYGYGIRTDETPHGDTRGHGGAMVASFTDVLVDPVRGIGSALIVNGFGDPWQTNEYLLERLRAAVDARTAPSEPTLEEPKDIVDDGSAPLFAAYVGLYRANNPWQPAYRVLCAEGKVYLVEPVVGVRTELLPRDDGGFDLRDAPPELVRFDTLADGQYLMMDVSGTRYVRARRDPR
jgi:CubicO group peptidase (beta-lactamase class C family)